MWWAYLLKEGRRHILGPFDSDVEANQEAEKYRVPFSLHELPTRDENRATRMIKAKYRRTEAISHGRIY